MGPQLFADHLVVPLRVARRPVDDVDEDARPLDVAEEGVAETSPTRRSFDEARDVGDRGWRRSSSSSMTPRFGSSVVNG